MIDSTALLPAARKNLEVRPDRDSVQVHPTNVLRPLLARLRAIRRPQVLDLGLLCGDNVAYLGRRGCRVYCNSEARSPGLENGSLDVAGLDYAPNTFDAVLSWDLFDLVERTRAEAVLQILTTVLKRGGYLMAFFSFALPGKGPLLRYRILAEDRVAYEVVPPALPHHRYQNREILELLAGYEIRSSCYLKNLVREILAVKR